MSHNALYHVGKLIESEDSAVRKEVYEVIEDYVVHRYIYPTLPLLTLVHRYIYPTQPILISLHRCINLILHTLLHVYVNLTSHSSLHSTVM